MAISGGSKKKSSRKKSSHKSKRQSHGSKRHSQRSAKRLPISIEVGKKKASQTMSMTELQRMARSLGIPFGGLNKSRLVYKINTY
jgi:hypothetical protein